jgi:hypothetical protein
VSRRRAQHGIPIAKGAQRPFIDTLGKAHILYR